MADKLVESEKVTCGLRSGKVENEWLIGREDRVMRSNITAALQRKNRLLEEQRRGLVQQREMEDAKEELKGGRRSSGMVFWWNASWLRAGRILAQCIRG